MPKFNPVKIFRRQVLTSFFQSEIAVGVIMIISTIGALAISNSNNYQIYQDFFNQKLDLNLSFFSITKELTLRDWINDALMALFFFLVGLELKSEILIGELSSRQKIFLPLACALGGVLFPILIFFYFNHNLSDNIRGFAVPCATDIAFAYGFIALFGKVFSPSLKIFLVALAIIDDLIAILIIAFFYTENLKIIYIFYALAPCFALFILNSRKSKNLFLYGFLGIILWLMILLSGIHATLAGVILALFIPLQVNHQNFLANIAHKIAPIINFYILPIFVFANSGLKINLADLINYIHAPIVLGIALGLFVGKQAGVMLTAFLALKLNLSKLPRGTSWLEFYGVSLFTGIGFTMSLFIASLAFKNDLTIFNQAKIGVLAGSLLSVIAGSIVAMIIKHQAKKYQLNKVRIY